MNQKLKIIFKFILGDIGPQGLPGIPGLTIKGEKGLPGK